jgi:hypothetical protein
MQSSVCGSEKSGCGKCEIRPPNCFSRRRIRAIIGDFLFSLNLGRRRTSINSGDWWFQF